MKISLATKVGITAVAGAITLASLVVWIGQLSPSKGYFVKANFADVGGLAIGSRVQFMGVRVGQVIDLVPMDTKVAVQIELGEDVKVPRGSSFNIISRGLVGDRVIEIMPPPALKGKATGYLGEGSEVEGKSPARIDEAIEEATKILQATRKLVDNPKTHQNIELTVENMMKASTALSSVLKNVGTTSQNLEVLSKQTNSFINRLNTIADSSTGDVQSILKSSSAIAKDLEITSANISQVVSDPQNIKKVNELLVASNNLAEKLDTIATDVSAVTQDKQLQQDLKEAVKNAREAARNARSFTEGLTGTGPATKPPGIDDPNDKRFRINMRTELLSVIKQEQVWNVSSRLHGNLNFHGNMGFGPVPYYKFGLDDLGERNLINFQLGVQPDRNIGVRFGLIRGKLGLGTDLKLLGNDTVLSGEAYDMVSPHMRIGIHQNLFGSDFGVAGYWDSQFNLGVNEFNLGLRWQPHN